MKQQPVRPSTRQKLGTTASFRTFADTRGRAMAVRGKCPWRHRTTCLGQFSNLRSRQDIRGDMAVIERVRLHMLATCLQGIPRRRGQRACAALPAPGMGKRGSPQPADQGVGSEFRSKRHASLTTEISSLRTNYILIDLENVRPDAVGAARTGAIQGHRVCGRVGSRRGRDGRCRLDGDRSLAARRSSAGHGRRHDAQGFARGDARVRNARRSYSSLRNAISQFTSQVFPPSSENACSHRADAGVTCDQVNRTLIGFPRNSSSA